MFMISLKTYQDCTFFLRTSVCMIYEN